MCGLKILNSTDNFFFTFFLSVCVCVCSLISVQNRRKSFNEFFSFIGGNEFDI